MTFNGTSHIIKGAKGADAQQEMPCSHASGRSALRCQPNPLLIDENDVTAGHAAFDRSSGSRRYVLPHESWSGSTHSRTLVVRGFLGSVIVEIPVKEVRDEMTATIEEKLSQR